MAAKKKAAPKRAKRKKAPSRKKTSMGADLKKIFFGLFILVLFVVGAGIGARYLLGPVAPKPVRQAAAPVPHKPSHLEKPARPVPVVMHKVPEYEIYSPEVPPAPKPAIPPAMPPSKDRPKVAIIIDDMGYDRKIAERFCSLNVPLTFSVLPYSPFRDTIVKMARAKGYSLMLHLPMEPKEYPEIDPGPDALLTAMEPDQLLAALKKNLDALPYVNGVNNHMGSRLSTRSDQMNQIFTVLKRRHLFYVDSRTTMKSKARQAARLLQVPFAQRDVFLDHVQDPAFVRTQLRHLADLAAHKGEAVGIGHPHSVTYEILQEMLPNLKSRVQLVPIDELVRQVD